MPAGRIAPSNDEAGKKAEGANRIRSGGFDILFALPFQERAGAFPCFYVAVQERFFFGNIGGTGHDSI